MAIEVRRCRPQLGTLVEIAIRTVDEGAAEAAIDAAFSEIAEVHRLMSFHEDGSDVTRINRAAAGAEVCIDTRTFEVLGLAAEMKAATGGVFDVAVARHLQRRGLLPGTPAEHCTASGTLVLAGPNTVRKTRGAGAVDLGGIAKGYAVDRAIGVLAGCGIVSALVDAGGDVAVLGDEPWPLAIRDPREAAKILCETLLAAGAMASSGGVLDLVAGAAPGQPAIVEPMSGAAASRLAGVSVRAARCVLADALTKAVMMMGEDAVPILERYGAGALAVGANGDVLCTGGWPMEVADAA